MREVRAHVQLPCAHLQLRLLTREQVPQLQVLVFHAPAQRLQLVVALRKRSAESVLRGLTAAPPRGGSAPLLVAAHARRLRLQLGAGRRRRVRRGPEQAGVGISIHQCTRGSTGPARGPITSGCPSAAVPLLLIVPAAARGRVLLPGRGFVQGRRGCPVPRLCALLSRRRGWRCLLVRAGPWGTTLSAQLLLVLPPQLLALLLQAGLLPRLLLLQLALRTQTQPQRGAQRYGVWERLYTCHTCRPPTFSSSLRLRFSAICCSSSPCTWAAGCKGGWSDRAGALAGAAGAAGACPGADPSAASAPWPSCACSAAYRRASSACSRSIRERSLASSSSCKRCEATSQAARGNSVRSTHPVSL